jgi:hypothetical protein
MSLIVGAQFHEAVRKAAQTASVIFYLGGFDPPGKRLLFFNSIGLRLHEASTGRRLQKPLPGGKDYFNKVELI